MKIDPIIVHPVTVNGSEWSVVVATSDTDSNLSHRTLNVVDQIMDLDLEKENNAHLTETLFQQDKQDGQDVVKSSKGLLKILGYTQRYRSSMFDWMRVVIQ